MIVLLLTFALVSITSSPVSWHFAAADTDDGKVLVTLTAEVEEGWHMYATELPSDEGPLPTIFRFKESTDYTVTEQLNEPEPVEEFDNNFGVMVRHHSGTPKFTLVVEPTSTQPFTVEGEVEYMVCNDVTCLPPKVVPFSITIERDTR